MEEGSAAKAWDPQVLWRRRRWWCISTGAEVGPSPGASGKTAAFEENSNGHKIFVGLSLKDRKPCGESCKGSAELGLGGTQIAQRTRGGLGSSKQAATVSGFRWQSATCLHRTPGAGGAGMEPGVYRGAGRDCCARDGSPHSSRHGHCLGRCPHGEPSATAVMVAPGLPGRRGHCEEPKPSRRAELGSSRWLCGHSRSRLQLCPGDGLALLLHLFPLKNLALGFQC